jgi:hypothetical protein
MTYHFHPTAPTISRKLAECQRHRVCSGKVFNSGTDDAAPLCACQVQGYIRRRKAAINAIMVAFGIAVGFYVLTMAFMYWLI